MYNGRLLNDILDVVCSVDSSNSTVSLAGEKSESLASLFFQYGGLSRDCCLRFAGPVNALASESGNKWAWGGSWAESRVAVFSSAVFARLCSRFRHSR